MVTVFENSFQSVHILKCCHSTVKLYVSLQWAFAGWYYMHLSSHFINSKARHGWNSRFFIKTPASGKSCSAASLCKCRRNFPPKRPAAHHSKKPRYGLRTLVRIVVLMQVWSGLLLNLGAFLHYWSLFKQLMNPRGMLQSV